MFAHSVLLGAREVPNICLAMGLGNQLSLAFFHGSARCAGASKVLLFINKDHFCGAVVDDLH